MLSGKQIDLPVYYDVEVPQGDYLDLSVNERTRLAQKWISGIRDMGYVPGLYTYLYYISKLNIDTFDCPSIWIAQYYSELEYYGRCDLWQYTSTPLDESKILDEGKWAEWLKGGSVPIPEPEPKPKPEKKGYVNMDMPILSKGDAGKAVESLQHVLQGNGYDLEYCGGADGIFGDGTEYAVKSLQRASGIDVDGVVGKQTWGVLFP